MLVKVGNTNYHNLEEEALKALLAMRSVGSQRGEGLEQDKATDPDVVTMAIIDAARTVQNYATVKLGGAPFNSSAVCTYIKFEIEHVRKEGTMGKGVFGSIVSMYEMMVPTRGVEEGGGQV